MAEATINIHGVHEIIIGDEYELTTGTKAVNIWIVRQDSTVFNMVAFSDYSGNTMVVRKGDYDVELNGRAKGEG